MTSFMNEPQGLQSPSRYPFSNPGLDFFDMLIYFNVDGSVSKMKAIYKETDTNMTAKS